MLYTCGKDGHKLFNCKNQKKVECVNQQSIKLVGITEGHN